MDVEDWLRSLGLGRYEQAFRANEIDEQILPSLTGEDLKEIGVGPVGHRRKLLEAIALLSAGKPSPSLERLSQGVASDIPKSAERRQLTIMFCDLVGSTALAARLDPEDLREVIGAYHRAVSDTVAAAGGFVAKYMGDGVLVYFGYPQAHEHDAEQAVRAGLALVDRIGRLESRAGTLCVRVGIATGVVVVGDLLGSGDFAGARGCRRNAEPSRPAAGNGRSRRGANRRHYASVGGRSVRVPQPRARLHQGAS